VPHNIVHAVGLCCFSLLSLSQSSGQLKAAGQTFCLSFLFHVSSVYCSLFHLISNCWGITSK